MWYSNIASPESSHCCHIALHAGNTRVKGKRMFDYVDATAFSNDQGSRARKLFAAVVLAALDDAIADDKKYGNGPEVIARWARRGWRKRWAMSRRLPT